MAWMAVQKAANGAQRALGGFAHLLVAHGEDAGLHRCTVAARLRGLLQPLGSFGRRHLVLAAEHEQHRAGGAGHGFEALVVAVAGAKAPVQHVGVRVAAQHPSPQRHARAIHPHPGPRGWRQRAAGKHVHGVQGFFWGVQRRVQQCRADAHGVGRAHQHQVAGTRAQLRCGLQCNQRTPAVADERSLVCAHRIEQGTHRLGGFLHAFGCVATAAAMAGQVDGQHVPAVVRQRAALQRPHAVVARYAVDEHSGGLCRVKGLATGVAVQGGVVDGVDHQAPALLE